MADYAIGDVQGCYDQLQQLLTLINFDNHIDRLWFVGDLVNRGPQSLEVLRFIYKLSIKPHITLGNHDLHLLSRLFTRQRYKKHKDNLQTVINSTEGEELGHWLRKQSLLVHDEQLNFVMCHAGIAPIWDLTLAKSCAAEVESVLRGEECSDFLCFMYGNEPHCWSNILVGKDRLRLITNYFTRMRLCDRRGCLNFSYKGRIKNLPPEFMPWYDVPNRQRITTNIVFGHWAALEGKTTNPTIFAIDTGCVWGGQLTALRLQDQQRFTVPGI